MTTERRPLTRQQEQVYLAVVSLIERHGYPPTVREICREAGLASTSTVAYHLLQIEARGWIAVDQAKARAIRVLP